MIIYKAHNKVNGKIYVGQTKKNVEQRILEHLKYTKNTYFSNALRKYGLQSFEISVIDVSENVEILNEKEKYWIKFFNCRAPNGYNLTDGGEGSRGMIMSLTTRKKISKSHKGKPTWNKGLRGIYTEKSLLKMSNSQKNREPASPETRQKISKANMGKKRSEEFKLNDALHKMGDLNPAKTPETRIKISKKLKGKFMGEINPMAKSSRKRKNLEELKNKGIILKGDTHEYLRKKIKCINIETQDILFFDGVQDLLKTLKINKRKYYAHLKDKQPILNKWICELLN